MRSCPRSLVLRLLTAGTPLGFPIGWVVGGWVTVVSSLGDIGGFNVWVRGRGGEREVV